MKFVKKLNWIQKRKLRKQFPETPQETQERLLKKIKRNQSITLFLLLIAELLCLGWAIYLLYLCIVGQIFL